MSCRPTASSLDLTPGAPPRDPEVAATASRTFSFNRPRPTSSSGRIVAASATEGKWRYTTSLRRLRHPPLRRGLPRSVRSVHRRSWLRCGQPIPARAARRARRRHVRGSRMGTPIERDRLHRGCKRATMCLRCRHGAEPAPDQTRTVGHATGPRSGAEKAPRRAGLEVQPLDIAALEGHPEPACLTSCRSSTFNDRTSPARAAVSYNNRHGAHAPRHHRAAGAARAAQTGSAASGPAAHADTPPPTRRTGVRQPGPWCPPTRSMSCPSSQLMARWQG